MKTKSYGLVEEGGKLAIAAGVLLTPTGGGQSAGSAALGALKGSNSVGQLGYALKQSLPLVGTDPAYATQRFQVGAGAVAAVAGPVLRKIPLVKRIARWGFKVDKKTRVRVA